MSDATREVRISCAACRGEGVIEEREYDAASNEMEGTGRFVECQSCGPVRATIGALRAEVARLRAELDRTADDVLAVLQGREPETWAWPLHGLRDALVAARSEAEGLRVENDRLKAMIASPSGPMVFEDGRDPTRNERHLFNLLAWRDAELTAMRGRLKEWQETWGEAVRLGRETKARLDALRRAGHAVCDAIMGDRVDPDWEAIYKAISEFRAEAGPEKGGGA
jgi:hypothetical protein